MWEGMLARTAVWLLVLARLGGMLGMNPLLARRNVPVLVRAGLTFLLAVLVAPGAPVAAGLDTSSLGLALGLLRELFVGFCCGFVFQVYYYLIFWAGDWMDMHFGLSMAKVFDPGTSIQMSLSGNLLNLFFLLYFFATDSHLLMVRVFVDSFRVLPVGGVALSQQAMGFFLELFVAAFSLILRLALPFVAAQFVLELASGILMRLIPQINIFVVNMQLKVLLGILLLLAFSGPVADFWDQYMRLMLENMQRGISALGG